MSLPRERTLILALLLILAAASWVILIWQSRTANGMGMGLTMGMGAALFLAIWVVMMIAMMFPTAAPMILVFARIQRDRGSFGRAFVPTWVFVGAYLLIWTLFGGLSYLGALTASGLAQQVPWIMMNAARIGGGILVLAGLYQLTPLKRVCLAKCRTPLDFILTSWRDGYPGSFRMGLSHGIYCLGSSWLLFMLLFPLGIMNIAAMALLTAQAFAAEAQNRWFFSPTGANRCPAFAVYRAEGLGGPYRAFGIQVVIPEAGASGLLVADVTTFLDPLLLTSFGFPQELPR